MNNPVVKLGEFPHTCPGDGCAVCRWQASKESEFVALQMTSRHGMRWDAEGRCFQTVNDGPEVRRKDCDFGTPIANLLIDPWMQEAVREKTRE